MMLWGLWRGYVTGASIHSLDTSLPFKIHYNKNTCKSFNEWNSKQRAKSKEQRAKSKEQRAKSKEQRAK
ncbi:hypothetical protein MWU31_23795, partial [Aeromonas hydrophila]|uniref:hypothetical protein n=1 Tax=Aeromonas hydrophila TaxID=644 RepID=UPI001FF53540